MIILQDHVVIPSINEYLIAVDLHDMKRAAIWHQLLELHLLKLRVDLQQRIIELVSRFAWIRWSGTSEDVDVLAHAAHGVALDALVGQVEAAVHLPPFEGAAIGVLAVLGHLADFLA